MGQLEILSRHEAESLNLDWPDLYFSPAYGRVVEHSDQGTWHVAIWRPGPKLWEMTWDAAKKLGLSDRVQGRLAHRLATAASLEK